MLAVTERKTHYHAGTKRTVTKEWRESVRARLKEIGHTVKWLETQLGVGNGSVSALLKRHQTSGLVDDICRILEIDLPTQVSDDEAAILEQYRGASPEAKAVMLATIAAIRRNMS